MPLYPILGKCNFLGYFARQLALTTEHANIVKNHATEAVRSELDSLQMLKTFINDDFVELVDLILASQGRLIITGIGKSAIIAQKIVATLNSTGQPSIFMHAADAIHGDLGMIQKDDIVMAISKSGNTPEIKALAPLLRRFGNKLIAMVGNIDSELAVLADYVINTTVDKEACPNNLAPTTSTTAQLIMGDALAVTLLKMRDFSGEDFSKYHPGGALGKKLYLRCGDLATKNSKPSVSLNASIKEVILEITRNRLGAVAVTDIEGSLMGIITDGDIRRMLENHDSFLDLSAENIMNPKPITVNWDLLAVDAAAILKEKKISQIVVLKDKKYAGMIHIHDLSTEGIL
jgi:arabinose-5-phosphate isomerase